MKIWEGLSYIIWNTCNVHDMVLSVGGKHHDTYVLPNNHSFVMFLAAEKWCCLWNAQPMHPATSTAAGAENRASWQVIWEITQLQICSSFLSGFIILDVLGKSAVWETIQGALS